VISLLPKPIPQGRVKADWRYVPSTQLGGDSFGYHWIDDNHFAFYLLDVCGHGVGSALLSVSALNVLRSQSLANIDFLDPGAVLAGMNESFQMSQQNNLYFTLWYGVYESTSRRLRYSSGGHPPAFLMGSGAAAEHLMTPNFMIGGFPKAAYTSAETTVEPGSRLYLFSDGVYEVDRPDETMWTLEELEQFLAEAPSGNASEMDALYAELQRMHASEILDDDFSMVRINFD
jgi:sigma-B regulation protein RsbU (phosphoserine phosphatase)